MPAWNEAGRGEEGGKEGDSREDKGGESGERKGGKRGKEGERGKSNGRQGRIVERERGGDKRKER